MGRYLVVRAKKRKLEVHYSVAIKSKLLHADGMISLACNFSFLSKERKKEPPAPKENDAP
jgi:hypothetical protein